MVSEKTSEFGAFAQNYRSVLERMAHVWLMNGASSFALTHEGQILFSIPEGITETYSLWLPVDGEALEIRVAASDTPWEQARLQADALLIARLLTLERELQDMTQELVTLQDQQLGLYELNRALDQCVELSTSLTVIAKISERVMNATNVVAALRTDGQEIIEQTGSKLSPHLLKIAFATNDQESRSLQPMLLDGGYMLCVPMKIDTNTPGVMVILRKHEFTAPEIKLALVISEQGLTHLHNVLLHEKQVAQARLQTEIDLARRVQTSLLPRRPVPQAGIDIYGISRAALHVGGDFFDFIAKASHAPLLVVGDVAGKGLSAAMVMTMTRTAMRSAVGVMQHSPAGLLRHVNDDLYDDFTELELFTTAFVARYEPQDGVLVYANAGHSPVIYCTPQEGARMLEADATALGVLPFCSCEDHTILMPPGAVLVAATDGMVEAEDRAGVRFGYDRFMREIELHAYLSAEALTEHLLSVVTAFREDMPQGDDQTLVILKRTETTP